MYTLNLPVVLSGFNWKHRGRILNSRSALHFIKHWLVPNVFQRYLGYIHRILHSPPLYWVLPHGKYEPPANCSWPCIDCPGPLIFLGHAPTLSYCNISFPQQGHLQGSLCARTSALLQPSCKMEGKKKGKCFKSKVPSGERFKCLCMRCPPEFA